MKEKQMATTDRVRRCHYCQTSEAELRPYGPGGSDICFPCMKAAPEREAQAKGAFGALLDASEQISPSGVVAIGEDVGPRPFDPRGECGTCVEFGDADLPHEVCPESRRPCGHHCNCTWIHDTCDWCGAVTCGDCGTLHQPGQHTA